MSAPSSPVTPAAAMTTYCGSISPASSRRNAVSRIASTAASIWLAASAPAPVSSSFTTT